MRVENINGEFYASITDAVRMAYRMEKGKRVWGKPLHTEATKLPGVIKHEGAYFAPAFDLAELIVGKTELVNFEQTAEQIILGAETARQKRREQAAREREEARKLKEEAEERELEAKKRERALEVIRKAREELNEAVIKDEKVDRYQEMQLQVLAEQGPEELDV